MKSLYSVKSSVSSMLLRWSLCPSSQEEEPEAPFPWWKQESPYRNIVDAVVRGPSREYRSPDHGNVCRCLCVFLPIES